MIDQRANRVLDASVCRNRRRQVIGRSNARRGEHCDRARASVACTIGDNRDSHRMTTSKSFERSGVLPPTNLIRQAFRDCPGISQSSAVNPRSTNPITTPVPIPCDALVTMAVFGGPLTAVHGAGTDAGPGRGRSGSGAGRTCRGYFLRITISLTMTFPRFVPRSNPIRLFPGTTSCATNVNS